MTEHSICPLTLRRTAAQAAIAFGCAAVLPAARGEEAAPAAVPPVDKSGYHLFHPTPTEHMREMTTDRPDKTESPYTVDAGHLQFEMEVNWTGDRVKLGGTTVRTESWGIMPINMKVGLWNSADLQLVIESWKEANTRESAGGGGRQTERQHGFGDITARFKYNFWGNDGGPSAGGVMPFIKAPTNQDHLGNDSAEGGIILPLALDLGRGFDLGVMTEFDFNRDAVGSGRHTEFVNSVTASHDIIGKLGGYLEFFSAVSTERRADWIGTVDLGFTYGLTPNLQLDTGVNIGVTKSADDLNTFLGLSWRY